jgi:hypothetical protein
MINTKNSSAILDKSGSGKIVPHDDALTVRDGHLVGHDGFIVPNSFSEFYQRFPIHASLLIDRFQLKFHRVHRQRPVYILAKGD